MNLIRYLFVFGLLISTELSSAVTSVPIELIASLLPDNPKVVEAGAQFGEDTRWMSNLWPKGAILAFEPSPDSYPSLEKLAAVQPNVFSFQLALSNTNGEMAFYLSGGASSLLPPQDHFNDDYFHVDLENPIMVQVARLDEWLEQQGISKVDFLWFDMEGNELNALQGTGRHLREITLIYTEVNLQRFWKGCVLYSELKDWLETQGFVEIWSEIIPDWQGNALFLNTGSQL